MIARILTSVVTGVEAVPVQVEVSIQRGVEKRFIIVGLGDASVREARDRVEAALLSSGFSMPERILVNLAPAELKKEGACFDVAIALGVLIASKQVRGVSTDDAVFLGELSLNGTINAIRGTLAHGIAALRLRCGKIFVPRRNAREAKLLENLTVFGVGTLSELISTLEGRQPPVERITDVAPRSVPETYCLSDVQGQDHAKRALIIAAAGGHNLLMIGPPGCGKSMLARRFPSILPKLTQPELLEVVPIHSVMGLEVESLLAGRRPFRSPHHVVSDAGLVGGGSTPRPGEITLAHRGVLFLDEFPEFRRSALEALRAPLEQGDVSVSRARGSVKFPARFQLLAAMNPCPCGRLGGTQGDCQCSRTTVANYLKKLSQPILDRIDVHIELAPVTLQELTSGVVQKKVVEQDSVASIVSCCREVQEQRWGCVNAHVSNEMLRSNIELSAGALSLLHHFATQMRLSARSFFRTLKLARTIADLAQVEKVRDEHVAEALSYRRVERLEQFARGDISRI